MIHEYKKNRLITNIGRTEDIYNIGFSLYMNNDSRILNLKFEDIWTKIVKFELVLRFANKSMREHRFIFETSVANSNFKILDHASSNFKLRILESLYIYKRKPKLNYMSSAMPLLVIKYFFLYS